ncbi:HYPDH dehydrogenase, partial [Piprites chloris]|nr:HYPDH dehydrogenase [Piprites chloris]
QAAVAGGVRLLVDAEMSHLNPALTCVTLGLMWRHNRRGALPWVWNTYQAYLQVHLRHTWDTRMGRGGHTWGKVGHTWDRWDTPGVGGTHLRHTWDTPGGRWDTPETYLRKVGHTWTGWDIPGTHLRHTGEGGGTHLGHTWDRWDTPGDTWDIPGKGGTHL